MQSVGLKNSFLSSSRPCLMETQVSKLFLFTQWLHLSFIYELLDVLRSNSENVWEKKLKEKPWDSLHVENLQVHPQDFNLSRTYSVWFVALLKISHMFTDMFCLFQVSFFFFFLFYGFIHSFIYFFNLENKNHICLKMEMNWKLALHEAII